MRFALIILSLLILMTSCHNPPLGLYESQNFDINNQVLYSIRKDMKSINYKNYSLSIDKHSQNQVPYSEEIFVHNDSVIWYADNFYSVKAFCDGTLYVKNENTGQTTQKPEQFSTEKHQQIIEHSKLILDKMFITDSKNITVVSCISSVQFNIKDQMITLEYYPTNDEVEKIKKQIPQFLNNGIQISFVKSKKTNTYSNFQLSWCDNVYNYNISFDVDECPSTLSSNVDGLIRTK